MLNLVAQAADQPIEQLCAAFSPISPHVLHERLRGNRLAWMGHQGVEQPRLERRKRAWRLPRDRDRPGGGLEAHVASLQGGEWQQGGVGTAPEERTRLRDKQARAIGARQHQIGACLV